jgi:catechol 2,3-dioxygenase-like lactoylglutathione lyase family enzyme
MASIEFVTLEVADPPAANRFYTTVFGLDTLVRPRASEAPTTGFRGFILALAVSQPADVNAFIGAALDAGATSLKPAEKVALGLRRRRASTRRDDLDAVVAEEGHRPGHPGDRRGRARAGSRGRGREQTVLR